MRRHRLVTTILALLAVYVLWGSTAPAMRVAVQSLPPWYMAASRFLLAGGILWLYVRWRRVPMPTPREWGGAVVTGGILLVLGNGMFAWCLQYMPSGIGALFFSLPPIFMAGFAFWFYRERLALTAAAGLVLGLGGMVYLIAPSGSAALPLWPVAVAIFSSVMWALGSVAQRWFAASDVVQASALQMLCGGAMLAVLAAVSGERIDAASLPPVAIGSVLYLTVFGSIVGYSCYVWLMRNVPTTLASTYSYVNPVVAIAIGVGLLHERLSAHEIIASVVMLLGVAMIALSPKPQQRTTGPAVARSRAAA
jgi:drug/metabolite transporter (DMT)-like permease